MSSSQKILREIFPSSGRMRSVRAAFAGTLIPFGSRHLAVANVLPTMPGVHGLRAHDRAGWASSRSSLAREEVEEDLDNTLRLVALCLVAGALDPVHVDVGQDATQGLD